MKDRIALTRCVSLMLALCLLIGMLPGTVYATVISDVSASVSSLSERMEERITTPTAISIATNAAVELDEPISADDEVKLVEVPSGPAITKIRLSEDYTSAEITTLFGLDERNSDPDRNAGLEGSGLSQVVYEEAAGYHGSENILNHQLASLKSELRLGNVLQKDYADLETLICSGYTYRQARAAIVSSETLGLSLDYLCEAKKLELTDLNLTDEEEVGLFFDAKEDLTEYSELATKLGLPKNAVAYYMKTAKSLTEEEIISRFDDAMELQYGGEETAVSVMATSSTPVVQYSPTHILDNPYDYVNYGNLDVNLASGSYRYSETDLSIPGINGLDLNFTRIYDSKFAYSQVPYGVSTGSYLSSYTLLVGMDIYVTYDFDNYEGLTLVSNPEDYYVEADLKYGDEYEIRYKTEDYDEAIDKYEAYVGEADGALYLVTDPDGDDAVAMLKPYIVGIGNFEYAFEQGQSQYDYLIDEFGLGHGWRLGFSAVERVYSITEDDVYWNLILSDGSVYRMEKNKQPKGLPGDLEFDWNDTTYTGSKYSLKHADGKVEYFNSKGRNIAIVDRYGNTIKLEYTTSGDEVTQIKITDTVGNIVLYKQEAVENPDEDGFATVEDYSRSASKHDLVWSLNLNGNRLKTYYVLKEDPAYPEDVRVMKIIKDEVGDYYLYSTSGQSRDFNCFVSTPTTNDGSIDYACLGQIKYPNGTRFKLSYSFTTSGGNVPYETFNDFGYQESVQLGNQYYISPSSVGDYMSDYYKYTYGDRTGYATLWNEETKFSTIVSKEHGLYDPVEDVKARWNGTKTEYVFNTEYEILKKTVTPYTAVQDEQYPPFSNSPDKMTSYTVTTYTYNADHLPTNITTKTYEPVLATETAPISYSSTVQKYTYDSKGNILTDTAPNGMVTTYTYNSTYNQPLTKTYQQDENTTIVETNTLTSDKKAVSQTIVTSNGTTVGKATYTYDDKGRMTGMNSYSSSSDSVAQTYTYGTGAQVTQVTTNGVKTADGTNALGTSGTADGIIKEQFTYNTRGWPISTTDANGETTSITYDGTGRITQVDYPDGGKDSYVYDTVNHTVRYTNAKNHTVTYKYDYFGNLAEVYDETAQTVLKTYKYDSMRNLVLETIHSLDSTKDISTYYYYDHMGRLIESGIRNNDGTNTPLETYEYDAASRKTKKTIIGSETASTRIETSYADKMGNVVRTGRISGGSEYTDDYTYDYLGNMVEYVSANSDERGDAFTSRMTYDHRGNLLTSTDALGYTTSYVYDWLGNLIREVDAKNVTTYYTNDVLGRVLSVTSPIDQDKNSVIKYTYDPNGNVIGEFQSTGTTLVDGEPTQWNQTEYSYDTRNRLTTVQNYDRTVISGSMYVYDAVGNRIKSILGASLTNYTYDQFGNVLTMTDPMGKMESYTYDLNGNILSKTDRNGIQTVYTYDNRGRLVSETIGTGDDSIQRNYMYSLNGDLCRLTEGTNTFQYEYDAFGRLVRESGGPYEKIYGYDLDGNKTFFAANALGSSNSIQTSYTYDANGRLSGVADGNVSADYTYDQNRNVTQIFYGNGVVQQYLYNLGNLPVQISTSGSGGQIAHYQYVYDLSGHQIEMLDSMRSSRTYYGYDGAGRLISEVSPEVGTVTYSYDDRGNRVQTVKNNTVTTYTYDLSDHLLNSTVNGVTTTYAYDNNGNLLSSQEGNSVPIQYSYNVANQLVGMNDTTRNLSVVYDYDSDGLRLSKAVNGEVTYYAWDHDRLVMEETETESINYIYGLNLVSRIPGTMYEAAEYYLHDAHGNVTRLTNQYGSVTTSYIYDAFGNHLNTGNSSEVDDNPFKYCSEYFDEETGTYYLKARNYVPTLGRFTQWDSYDGDVTIPASLNHYVYCYNDPIALRDPSGNIPIDTLIDGASWIASAKELYDNPSWPNAGWLLADSLALAIPYATGVGAVKYLDNIDDVADGAKLLDKGSDVAKSISKTTDLIYSPSPKHNPKSGWGSPNPIPDEETGQRLLETAYSSSNKKQLYNVYEGQLIKFQPDTTGGWHPYVVKNPAREIPADVYRKMMNDGLITKSQYNSFLKNNYK